MSSFQDNIKDWVAVDNRIKNLNGEIKQLRTQKNERAQIIMNYVESNNLSNAIVNISDGKLRFTETKQKEPLTFKYIEACLSKCIAGEKDVKDIMKFIKTNRETKIINDIKRSYNK
jgi:hypothetical protein